MSEVYCTLANGVQNGIGTVQCIVHRLAQCACIQNNVLVSQSLAGTLSASVRQQCLEMTETQDKACSAIAGGIAILHQQIQQGPQLGKFAVQILMGRVKHAEEVKVGRWTQQEQ